MDPRVNSNLVHLDDSSPGRCGVNVYAGFGHRVVAVSGTVWVTQFGDAEDYVLRPGEAVTVRSPGLLVVTSFGPADVELIAPQEPPRLIRGPAIDADAIERAQREGRRLHSQAIHRAVGAGFGRLRSLWQRLLRVATTSPAPIGNACQHC